MQRLLSIVICLVLLLGLAACGQVDSSLSAWQGQYDLGIQYLSEGSYEEAIIAFNAAIGIDPKQLEAYTGLAGVYIGLGEYDQAAEIIAHGRQACGDSEEFDRMMEEITDLQLNQADIGQDEETAADLQYEEKDDGTGLNAYGATSFTRRENYLAFADMTPEQQQLIETAGNAAIANDVDAFYDILDVVSISASEVESVYTIWNGYKMQLRLGPRISGDGTQYDSRQILVIMRPENGAGFYCRVVHNLNLSNGTESFEEERITCQCIDWQWNGAMERIERDEDRGSTFIYTESGQMIDSLRDGEFIYTAHLMTYTDETHTIINLYQNGELIESNGEKPQMVPAVTSINFEGAFSPEDIYW